MKIRICKNVILERINHIKIDVYLQEEIITRCKKLYESQDKTKQCRSNYY